MVFVAGFEPTLHSSYTISAPTCRDGAPPARAKSVYSELLALWKDADAVLADMNDEAIYGPELHRLGFGDAVDADLLTDYKVLVLAVDEAI